MARIGGARISMARSVQMPVSLYTLETRFTPQLHPNHPVYALVYFTPIGCTPAPTGVIITPHYTPMGAQCV